MAQASNAQTGDFRVCNCSLNYWDCCGRNTQPYQYIPNVYWPTELKSNCDKYGHCYCKTVKVGLHDHVVCCNCKHKLKKDE